MKRDWDLVRAILLTVEGLPPDESLDDLSIAGFDGRVVDHHVALMIEADLLHGTSYGSLDAVVSGHTITGLTWAGHDFLDKARDDVLWRKAMKQTREAGTGLSFSVLGDLLTTLAKGALDL